MKIKKIVTIVMALTLALGVAGCGKDEESDSTTATQEESSESKAIKRYDKAILELGAKQTPRIVEILEKYDIKTASNSEDKKAQVLYAKDENDSGTIGTTGYTLQTTERILLDDGGQNKYNINYKSFLWSEGKGNNGIGIDVIYTENGKFNIDNFGFLKELIQVYCGDDYDINSLESWIQEFLETGEGKKFDREVGNFKESIQSPKGQGEEINKRILSIGISMKKI